MTTTRARETAKDSYHNGVGRGWGSNGVLRREENPGKRLLVREGETELWPAPSSPDRPAELAKSKVPWRHHLPQ